MCCVAVCVLRYVCYSVCVAVCVLQYVCCTDTCCNRDNTCSRWARGVTSQELSVYTLEFEFQVSGVEVWIWNLEIGVQCPGFKVQGLEFTV